MSGYLQTWAVDEGERLGLPLAARMLLVVLARMANNGSGESWPSKACLARKTGMPLRSLYRAMERLVAEDLVTRTQRGKSWLYKVVMPTSANGAATDTIASQISAKESDDQVSSAKMADLLALSRAVDARMAARISATKADEPQATTNISAIESDELPDTVDMSAVVADEAENIGQICTGHRPNPTSDIGQALADRTTKKELLKENYAREAARSPDGGGPAALQEAGKEEPAPSPTPQPATPGGSTHHVPMFSLRKPPDPFDDAGEDHQGTVRRIKPLPAPAAVLQAFRAQQRARVQAAAL